MNDDARIIASAARHRGTDTELDAVGEEDAIGRLADLQHEIEQEMAKLTPTTPFADVELISVLSQHDDAGLKALGVLRGLHGGAA